MFEVSFDKPDATTRDTPKRHDTAAPCDYVEPDEVVDDVMAKPPVLADNATIHRGPDQELQELALSYDKWGQGDAVPDSPFSEGV